MARIAFNGARPGSWGARDIALLAALGLLIAVAAFLRLSHPSPPLEDAAMLMRYAEHLAAGHGIVWNVGEAPVDGATDFLFMVMAAGLVKAGLGVETAVRTLALAAHVATVLFLYWAIRSLHGAGRRLAGLTAAAVALGPAIYYVRAGFGTPVFALVALVAGFFALRIAYRGESAAAAAGFAAAALLTSLVRPEGVLLTGFFVLGVVSARGVRGLQRTLVTTALAFGILGGSYFLWHWWYFGHPLPNPFYKKGSGALHWNGLLLSLLWTSAFTFPFVPGFVLSLRNPERLRRALAGLLPVAGFAACWVLVSPATNYLGRFQYAVLPLAALAWPDAFRNLREDFRLPSLRELSSGGRRAVQATAALAAALFVLYPPLLLEIANVRASDDGRFHAALALRGYADRGYSLATTEAGLIPFYSTWKSIDAWGLNDPWIARHGGVTAEYLNRYRPEVIVIHAAHSPLAPKSAGRAAPPGSWSAMVAVLEKYARSHGYVLAAAFGTSVHDSHEYWVRPGFPDSGAIVTALRGLDYTWPTDGRRAVDLSRVLRASAGSRGSVRPAGRSRPSDARPAGDLPR